MFEAKPLFLICVLESSRLVVFSSLCAIIKISKGLIVVSLSRASEPEPDRASAGHNTKQLKLSTAKELNLSALGHRGETNGELRS